MGRHPAAAKRRQTVEETMTVVIRFYKKQRERISVDRRLPGAARWRAAVAQQAGCESFEWPSRNVEHSGGVRGKR